MLELSLSLFVNDDCVPTLASPMEPKILLSYELWVGHYDLPFLKISVFLYLETLRQRQRQRHTENGANFLNFLYFVLDVQFI